MNKQEHYQQWLEHKQVVDVPQGFAQEVMTAINRKLHKQPVSWGESRVITPLTQFGLAAVAIIVFVVRFVLLFQVAVG